LLLEATPTMFVDEAEIEVRAGKGGDGCISFHREKYRPKGGPDGGNGGRGGSVLLVADSKMASLIDFEHERLFRAQDGMAGCANRGSGRAGKDIRVRVPVGSVISDAETGDVYGDLLIDRQELLIAVGGRPGRGNHAFTTSTRQAPDFGERGLRGERVKLRIELKLLADVGLVGLPNAGKSSFLRIISAARPKVAAYPFTTLKPELGVYRVDEAWSYIVADIPGLIEGAHAGVGLGDAFLRHLERTRLLVHLVDISCWERPDPLVDYETIRNELTAFGHGLDELPTIVALNKVDIGDAELVEAVATELRSRGCEVHLISAATGEGCAPVMAAATRVLHQILRETPPMPEQPKRLTRPEPPVRPLRVTGPVVEETEERTTRVFEVSGTEVETIIAQTHMGNSHALLYLHSQLVTLGVLDSLERRGAREGDVVRIGTAELEYIDSAYVRDD
jgi:GTPase